jgi:hypothetical protein
MQLRSKQPLHQNPTISLLEAAAVAAAGYLKYVACI